MTETKVSKTEQRLRTPRAAAVAGIIFALLLSTSYVLIRLSIPENIMDSGDWLEDNLGTVSFALTLVPIAGLFFLYFMGVMRDRLGELEDQFFSTVFFGSGILYLALTFVAAALAGGLLVSYANESSRFFESGVYSYARAVMHSIINLYSVRMAGIFMTSLATIWLKTKVVNRYLTILTYVLAVILLVIINFSLWVTLIFPAWIFIISLYTLILNHRLQPKK
jgi:hypothetical protein